MEALGIDCSSSSNSLNRFGISIKHRGIASMISINHEEANIEKKNMMGGDQDREEKQKVEIIICWKHRLERGIHPSL